MMVGSTGGEPKRHDPSRGASVSNELSAHSPAHAFAWQAGVAASDARRAWPAVPAAQWCVMPKAIGGIL